MIVSVVGNGPSAEGMGHDIDTADVVIRVKAFWAHGADNAGEKTDVVVWFGQTLGWDRRPADLHCEHWYTHPPTQVLMSGPWGRNRLRFFNAQAAMRPIRWITHDYWRHLAFGLKRHPSTGFIAVAMAMQQLRPRILRLFGFDSTTPDRPDYYDAHQEVECPNFPHAMLKEKLVVAKLWDQRWLGRPCDTVLRWKNAPPFVHAIRAGEVPANIPTTDYQDDFAEDTPSDFQYDFADYRFDPMRKDCDDLHVPIPGERDG